MKVRLLLAHSAEVQNSLLYALGAGWTAIGPAPSPFAIAAIVEVAWDETSHKHRLEIVFEDADGQPVLASTLAGEEPFRIPAEFEVGRPPGAVQGTSFIMPIALNIPPIQLPAGRQCVVKACINGNVLDELSFVVRPAPPSR
ncbi:MAG: hypothetical protein HYV93_10390 [Candidatus Rokubacteria bacterium]|nr:hypothetical protein [Candidatus Rokubacteria bacterium]